MSKAPSYWAKAPKTASRAVDVDVLRSTAAAKYVDERSRLASGNPWAVETAG
jgi:hypothetical protein